MHVRARVRSFLRAQQLNLARWSLAQPVVHASDRSSSIEQDGCQRNYPVSRLAKALTDSASTRL
eukprot:1017737-Alexandrium_andersonii.AAC.1